MNIIILTPHKISFKKPLKIAFWKKMTKAIEKLKKLLEIKNCTKFTKGG